MTIHNLSETQEKYKIVNASDDYVAACFSSSMNNAEALTFPPWSEMTAKQLQAAILAASDALNDDGPPVHVMGAPGREASGWQDMFVALARMVKGEE